MKEYCLLAADPREETPHPARDGWWERPSRYSFSPSGKENKVLTPAGRFVPIHLASGRHRATYLAEYCRVGKTTHRRAGFEAPPATQEGSVTQHLAAGIQRQKRNSRKRARYATMY